MNLRPSLTGDRHGQALEVVAVGQAVTLRIQAKCHQAVPELVIGYMIKDRLGQPVFGTNTHHLKRKMKQLPSQHAIECQFEFDANLGPGSYSIAIALHADDTHLGQNYEWSDQAILFSVVNINQPDFVGVAWLPPEVRYTP